MQNLVTKLALRYYRLIIVNLLFFVVFNVSSYGQGPHQVYVRRGQCTKQFVTSTGHAYTGPIQISIQNSGWFTVNVKNGHLGGLHVNGCSYTGIAWVSVSNRQRHIGVSKSAATMNRLRSGRTNSRLNTLRSGGANGTLKTLPRSGGGTDGTLKWKIENGVVTYDVPGGFLPGNEGLRHKPYSRRTSHQRFRTSYEGHILTDEDPQEIIHQGERGLFYRGVFVSWEIFYRSGIPGHKVMALKKAVQKPSIPISVRVTHKEDPNAMVKTVFKIGWRVIEYVATLDFLNDARKSYNRYVDKNKEKWKAEQRERNRRFYNEAVDRINSKRFERGIELLPKQTYVRERRTGHQIE